MSVSAISYPLKTQETTFKRIALLKGGWNSEREVSLSSAKGVRVALDDLGYEVLEIDVTRDLNALIHALKSFNPDLVFMNALHGQYVEDGKLQSVLEILNYPYTGSNVAASAMAMDKSITRTMLEQKGVRIPKGLKYRAELLFSKAIDLPEVPLVIKPVSEGSSVGVFMINTPADLDVVAKAWCYGDTLILEEYIPGLELSVALLNENPLGVLELKPKSGFYDYRAKYTDGLTEHIMPSDIPENDRTQILNFSAQAVQALGVRGVSRVDLRYDPMRPSGERAFVLEVNTLPGMTPLSIVPDIAGTAGITFNQLVNWMIQNPTWPENHQHEVNLDDEPQAEHKQVNLAASF